MTSDRSAGYDVYSQRSSEVAAVRERSWRLPIGGRLTAAGTTFETVDPATQEKLAEVPQADASDVGNAVEAGKLAFEGWRRETVLSRARVLRELAQVLREHVDELAFIDALDSGNPVKWMVAEVKAAADFLDMYAGWGLEVKGTTIPATTANLHFTEQVPFGVVGRIIAFNHPLLFAVSKIAAPLIVGNVVVLKPSEHTPLSALRMGELFNEVLPPGVLSVVTGAGPGTGVALAAHPDVRRIAFTGSEAAGRAVQRTAAESSVKSVSLELGGKNAMIVLPDADLMAAAQGAVTGMNFVATQGQSCGSNSRLIVHEAVAEELLAEVAKRAEAIRIGVPLDPASEMGALVSRRHFDFVSGHIAEAVAAGAEVVTGGGCPEGLERGLFISPTVLGGVTGTMRIAQEEVFGPVLSVLVTRDEEEAIQLANSVRYGLTGSVWTSDLNAAFRVARSLQTGFVWINGSGSHFPAVPFGGMGDSGVGREENIDELYSYTQTKAYNVMLPPA